MKKKLSFFLAILSIFTLISCGKNDKDNNDNTGGNDGDGQVKVDFEDLFKGDWNRPGLYDKDGNAFIMPEEIKEEGMENNVVDYGAVADDVNADNSSAFNNAISNAADGDTVFIPNGTYYFNTYYKMGAYYAHIKMRENITLRGESKDGVILVSKGSENENTYNSTTVISACNVSNVMIKDLTVTSDTPDSKLPDPNDSVLQPGNYTGPKYGITLAADKPTSESSIVRNLVVDNVLVEKFQRMAVRVASVRECVVRNSTFQKALGLGGGGLGYGVCIQGLTNNFDCTDTYADTRHNIIENNKFVGPYLRHGALVQYSGHNNVIRNNEFTDLLLDAIDMHGEDEYSNEIHNNKITNSRKGAAFAVGNTGATHDASGRNNYFHDNIIEGGARAIDCMLGTPNTVIYNNTINNTEKGISCTDANGTRIVGNKFTNVKNDGVNIIYSYNALDPSIGVPNNYVVVNNSFDSCGRGIYLDSKGDNFTLSNNEFKSMNDTVQIVDISADFVLPGKSELTNPIEGGVEVRAIQDSYITTETPDTPIDTDAIKNYKLKTSNAEPKFNRMIYSLFDVNNMPEKGTYDKVYIAITAKAQVGAPTINISSNTTFTNWNEKEITWNNSKLHDDSLAMIKSTDSDPVNPFYEFKFPFVGYSFQTYYLDVTQYYEALMASGDFTKFTLVLTNEAIDESYIEVYSRDTPVDTQQFRFIFK